MFENYGPYLEILELAHDLAKKSVPFQMIPQDVGWALIFYQPDQYGELERKYTLIVDDHSLDRDQRMIEVNEGEAGDVRQYSLDQDDCFDMIMEWYKETFVKEEDE